MHDQSYLAKQLSAETWSVLGVYRDFNLLGAMMQPRVVEEP